VNPRDRRIVALLCDQFNGVGRDRREWIVTDLRTIDDWQPLVEEFDQRANHPGFRLSTLTQQDYVVSRQQRRLELGQHGVLVAEHVRRER